MYVVTIVITIVMLGEVVLAGAGRNDKGPSARRASFCHSAVQNSVYFVCLYRY